MALTDIAAIVRDDGTTLLDATDQVDAVVDACARALRPHTLRVDRRGHRLAARLHQLPGTVDLSRLTYGADVTITHAAPEHDEFIIALPLAGRAQFRYGRSEAALVPGSMSVVGPYRRFTLEISDEFDQVLVRLDRRRVEAAAALLVGAATPVPVHFDLVAARVSPGLIGLIEAAARVATDARLERRDRMSERIEALVTDALLLGHPSELSGRLAGTADGPAAARVTRAMDYMVGHLADPLVLPDVARHCGVTLRSLQTAFQRETGMSPGQWLRERRLDHAHALLTAGDPAETTVTAIAVACGCPHLGDFGVRFKQRFGVTPSMVLRAH